MRIDWTGVGVSIATQKSELVSGRGGGKHVAGAGQLESTCGFDWGCRCLVHVFRLDRENDNAF